MSSIRDRLKGQASTPGQGDYPELIRFDDAGDEVAGLVTSVRHNVKTKMGESPVVAIDCELAGEEVAFFAGSYNLNAALIEGDNGIGRPVRKGDEVYVRYEGSAQTSNGNTVKTFAIAVAEGEAPAPAQDAPADDSEDTPF